MSSIDLIFLLVHSVNIFSQGFFIGRNNKSGVFVTGTIAFILIAISVSLNDVNIITDYFTKATPQLLLVIVLYAALIESLGYIYGKFVTTKERMKEIEEQYDTTKISR